MKYYQIIVDNAFIGAVNSHAFLEENPRSHKLHFSTDTEAQFVDHYGILYRDYWMRPLFENTARNFIQANITEITEEEYNIIQEAIHNNEEVIIEDDEEEEEEITPIIDEEDTDATVEFLKETKLSEMSHTCRLVIENGFDLELRNEVYHFSLDTQDQLNLISLSAMAQTQSLIPYHADGEACIFYTAEEMNEIVETATAFKIYHTTYYNALKAYINSLNTIEEIAAIEYGIEIPEEYKSDVLKALEV